MPTLIWSSLAAEEEDDEKAAGKLSSSHSRSLEQLVVIDLAIDLILCTVHHCTSIPPPRTWCTEMRPVAQCENLRIFLIGIFFVKLSLMSCLN